MESVRDKTKWTNEAWRKINNRVDDVGELYKQMKALFEMMSRVARTFAEWESSQCGTATGQASSGQPLQNRIQRE